MTKKDLINHVAENSNTDITKKDTEAILDATFSAIGHAIKADERFAWPGFGIFTVKERTARSGRNPQTGKAINIKASKTVAFKPAPGLKDSL